MKKIMTGIMAVVLASAMGGTTLARPPAQIRPSDLYRARSLQTIQRTRDLAEEHRGAPWVFSEEEHCNFTFVSPETKEVSFTDKGLSFVSAEEAAVLGWGNYDGRQPRAERLLMFPGWNEIELDVSQSADESTWALELWADGTVQRRGGYGAERLPFWAVPRQEHKLTGTEQQTLRFQV